MTKTTVIEDLDDSDLFEGFDEDGNRFADNTEKKHLSWFHRAV